MDASLNELAQQVATALSEKNLKLVTVESCTGGYIAKLLTDIPGSSQWFDSGLVTYSNEAKIRHANVPRSLIEQQGAVSQKVALAMAKGGLSTAIGDISIATSGIAGPDGGTPDKPVGTVCFGFATRTNDFSADKKLFTGDRESIRKQSAQHALKCLLNYLQTNHF